MLVFRTRRWSITESTSKGGEGKESSDAYHSWVTPIVFTVVCLKINGKYFESKYHSHNSFIARFFNYFNGCWFHEKNKGFWFLQCVTFSRKLHAMLFQKRTYFHGKTLLYKNFPLALCFHEKFGLNFHFYRFHVWNLQDIIPRSTTLRVDLWRWHLLITSIKIRS